MNALAKLYGTLYFYTGAGLEKLRKNERGQGTLEYVGMIAVAAVIVVAVIVALKNAALGDWVNGFISSVKNHVSPSS